MEINLIQIALLPIGGRREKKTFDIITNLSSTVVESVKEFKKGVQAYSELDFETAKKHLENVRDLESKADKHGFNFELKLGGGEAFLPTFRGDLSRLAESIDDIADIAEETINEIDRRPVTFEKLSDASEKAGIENIGTDLVELAERAIESAKTLDDAVGLLINDIDKAAEKAEEVHRKERKSDEKEDELARKIYEIEEYLDPITVMQVRELIEKFGSISDAAENSGDTLSAMANVLRS
ncbi:MAG: DUF47 domain-containing protein [Candidatus Hadarchaeia archaeon]